MKLFTRLVGMAAFLSVIGIHSHVSAVVTVHSYFRLGENDPGSGNGISSSATKELVSGQNLTLGGSPSYTSNVDSLVAAATGSALALNFSGAQSGSGPTLNVPTDNFGFELWVNPANTASQVAMYNGGPGPNGWGVLINNGGNYEVLYGSVAFWGGTIPATAGVWTHLAVVCDNGLSTFYVNGSVAGTFNGVPNPPDGGFAIACTPPDFNSNFFTGAIDEVRVFTFAPGQFSTNDLSLFPQVSITTGSATNITETSAVLQATLNSGPSASWFFQYGTTTNYGNSTTGTQVSDRSSAIVVSKSVSQLTAGGTYHFRAVASNSLAISFGADQTFVTPGAVPEATTLPAFGVHTNRATLYGSANAKGASTHVYFAYGLTTNYGSTNVLGNIGNGTNTLALSRDISGLSPGQTYHFRLIASNSVAITRGDDLTFFTTAPFTNVIGTGVTNRAPVTAGGDYDADGRLDLLFQGWNGSSNICQIWKNNGNDTFSTNSSSVGLPIAVDSAAAWGDYDNDGRLDFATIGNGSGGRISQVWRNVSNNSFTNINAGITPVSFGSVAWGDFNNDGRLDLSLCGHDGTNYVAQIWRNNGNHTFSNIGAGLPPLRDGSVRWADYDNDGFNDLLISGQSNGVPICQIWRNRGNNTFTNIVAGLTGVWRSAAVWGDYDNDGKLDVLLSGATASDGGGSPTNAVTQIWRNAGNGVFTNINAGLTGVFSGSVAWGDYENSGKLAVLLTGRTNSNSGTELSQVWRQIAGGFFAETSIGLTNLQGTGAWGDFNNDGRLDLVVTAAGITQIWKGQGSATNRSPAAPTGLTSTFVSSNCVLLSWNAASDLETSSNGLSYNVRVGTTAGGDQIISGAATATNGFRRVAQLGNAGQRLSVMVTNLNPASGTYYWSVQAVDTAFAGSAFAAEAAFSFSVPMVTTLSATDLRKTSAVVRGQVNPNGLPTTAWFQWGATTNYGNQTASSNLGNGTNLVALTNLVSGLPATSTFQFRCVASNSVGVTFGQNLSFTTTASGVTNVHFYHLGEDDQGTIGGSTTITRDSVGTQDLTVSGSPIYSTNVSALANIHANSSVSLNCANGTAGFNAPVISTLTDNFGFEIWVRPSADSDSQFYLYNGSGGGSGWGFIQSGDTYHVLFGGVELFGAAPIVDNQWTHLAVVRDNGVATFYVNGVAHGSTGNGPNPADGSFQMTVTPGNSPSGNASVDELRVFTFAPGTFDVESLLLNAVELPSFTNVRANGNSPGGATVSAVARANGAATAVWFEYGLTVAYGSSTPTVTVPVGSRFDVSRVLSGLSPNVTYHYRIVGTNSLGISRSEDYTFFTATAPQATTLAAVNVSSTNATLMASVNPGTAATTVHFEYGSTTNYGSVTTPAVLAAGGGAQSVSHLLVDLPIVSTFHFRVVATNAAGITLGSDIAFTTLAEGPIVTTKSAFGIRADGATLPASVDPRGAITLVWFEYGLTTNYGSYTATSSVPAEASLSISNLVSRLTPGTPYQFRAVASNAIATRSGANVSFTTPLASVTNFVYYRLGEADTNAIAGQLSTSTHNSMLTNTFRDLSVSNGRYSTDVGPTATLHTESALSMDFTGSGYASSASAIFNLTDNFGLEVWAKLVGGGSVQVIACNGQPSRTGFSIERSGGNFVGRFGNNDGNPAFPGGLPVTITVGSAPWVANVWTHLALVRNNGVATFYVNGVPCGSTTAGPDVPNHRLALATRPDSPSQSRFIGLIDEVRIFTFAPGAFHPKDLLLAASNAPSLSIGGSLDANLNLQFAGVQDVEYTVLATTNIALPATNWSNLGNAAYLSNGLFQFTVPATNAPSHFFKLRSP